MSRIRSIKPEFWTNEQVMECSLSTRLMFIGMWNFADDAGRMNFSPKSIKAQIFPTDDLSSEDVRGMVQELSKNGLIRIYTVDGKEYLQITGWHHQRIDKPQKPKCPEPLPDNSKNAPIALPPDPIGKEGKGDDRRTSEAKASAPVVAAVNGEVTEAAVYRLGEDVLGHNAGGQVTKLRRMFKNDIPKVYDVLLQAKQKGNARKWIAGLLKGSEFAEPTADEICPPDVYENVL